MLHIRCKIYYKYVTFHINEHFKVSRTLFYRKVVALMVIIAQSPTKLRKKIDL